LAPLTINPFVFLPTASPGAIARGLITGKPIVVVYARGCAYGPGTGMETYDAQSTYLKQVLGFIGFTDIKEIFVEPTLASPTSKDDAIAAADKKATELASAF